MKMVFVFVLCLILIPAFMTADNIRGAHVIKSPYPQECVSDMSGARDGWLSVDDGTPYGAAAWYDAGDGAGVEYIAPYDCVVGSIMVHMGNDDWPDPGDNYITLRIYEEETRGPGDMVWENTGLWADRGVWNTYEVNLTAPPNFPFNHSMYVFYHQEGALPNCPSFSYDDYCDYPGQSWTYWYAGGGFFNEDPGGDWMIRTFVYSEPGVGEWLSITPIEPKLIVNTITKGTIEIKFTLADPMHVELLVYDIMGREQMIIVSQHYDAGTHVVKTQLDLSEGVYFFNLHTDTGFNITKKFVVIQ